MLRRFVGDLCMRVIEDADITSRVVVAAHELFDNAIRHAADGQSRLTLEVHRLPTYEAEILLATENTIDGYRVEDLRVLLAAIASAGDRAAYYQELLGRVADRAPAEPPIGLGLGRIHAETDLALTGHVVAGIAHVAARGRLPLRGGAR